MSATILTGIADIYNPHKVLKHHDFKVLAPGEIPQGDANIAAFYNPNREILGRGNLGQKSVMII